MDAHVYCNLGAERSFRYVTHEEGLNDFEHVLTSIRAI